MKRRERSRARGKVRRAHADEQDLAERFFGDRSCKADHKTPALCRQVQQALTLALGACKDELLQNLYIRDVVPAPDATHLVVMVQPTSVHSGAAVPELLFHLERARGMLRYEVAQAVTRKRAPELSFVVVRPEEATL